MATPSVTPSTGTAPSATSTRPAAEPGFRTAFDAARTRSTTAPVPRGNDLARLFLNSSSLGLLGGDGGFGGSMGGLGGGFGGDPFGFGGGGNMLGMLGMLGMFGGGMMPGGAGAGGLSPQLLTAFVDSLTRFVSALERLAPRQADITVAAPAGSAPAGSAPAGSAPAATALAAGGPAAAVGTTGSYASLVSAPMRVEDFPRPPADNGRGMHWIPTTHTVPNIVDRFVGEAKEMGVKWVVFLNDHTQIGNNDYLITRLRQAGIEPIMRIYTAHGAPIQGDLAALVRHARSLGVNYFQLYNEPNLNDENMGQDPDPARYVDMWLPAARTVIENGGLPGFGNLAPGGNYDDMEFLKKSIDIVKQRGEERVFNRSWLGMHNYTFNHPIDYMKDSNGFMKFKWYDQVMREKLGRSIPIIGTEGGTHVGAATDSTFPAVTEEMQTRMLLDAYTYMEKQREPWNFAYTHWVIANEEGGGHDPFFRHHALFQPGKTAEVVDRLKALTRSGASPTARV